MGEMKMHRLLSLKTFPYLLTLIIAIIGFQINYLIKITTETPTVKYDLYKVSEKTDSEFSEAVYNCRLKNITDMVLYN